MLKKSFLKNKILSLLTILPLIIFIIFRFPVFSMNVDEAGQYWIALGQNHYSEFNTPIKGISEVINFNIRSNLDPGGFSILLHFWLKCSHNYLWIKLLPLIFFIGFVIFSVKLLRLFLEKDRTLSYLIIPILFLSNALPLYGVFLRAYSMEYFGIILTLYILFKYENLNEFYLKAGIICALFLWSRYGFAIHILAFFLTSLIKFKNDFNYKKIFFESAKFILPVIISSLIIYFITLRFQFIKPTHNPFYMKYMSNGDLNKSIHLILSQLTSYINLPIIFFILMLIFVNKRKKHSKKLNLKLNNINILLFYFGFYHLINFILAYLGLYPYSAHSYNSKQFEYFNILCIFFILIIILYFFKNYSKVIILIIACAGSCFAFYKRNAGIMNLYSLLKKYNCNEILYVSNCNYPTTRYIYEEKMIALKFREIKLLEKNSNIKKGSLIFFNKAESDYTKNFYFDDSFIKLESVNLKKPGHNSEVYIKK